MSNLSPLSPHPRLFVRWFVQYNPFFTASALCVLGGVLVLSRALGRDADVALTGVLEVYQWIVLGAAALLYRRLCEHRAGVILGLIALVLLLDPTLQLSALASSGQVWLCALWVLVFALKWRALQWAFCLELNATARLLPPAVAALVAALPNVQLLGLGAHLVPALLAVAVFALGVALVLVRPQVRSRRALGDVGSVMFPRVARGVALIVALGLAYQGWNAVLALGGGALRPAFGAALLVGAVAATRERHAWIAVLVGSLVLLPSAVGTLLGPALLAVALLLAARRHPPRVVLAVVPPLAMLHAAWLWRSACSLAPDTPTGWGALLLGAGFLLLPLGVVLHRRLSAVLARADGAARLLDASSPATSAGFGGVLGPS
ncbi:MAG: hypothetical protein HYS27_13220 [Deltaproteobacteria bacterium]|nr:hypothetical protein [Deltaproteobacteria bacterium]